jgi:hypothetical protein
MVTLTEFVSILLLVPATLCYGEFMPSRTTASRWTGDIVLCYMDARSTGAFGPAAQNMFDWNSTRFARLLAYFDKPADAGGGHPTDTLFDSFLFTGYKWYGKKQFWPGTGPPMNKTDWQDFSDMAVILGAENLEIAAKNVSAQLPFPPSTDSCSSGVRPSVIVAVPYPDVRQQDFGSIDGSGRSLNFSLPEDRLAAVTWFVRRTHGAFGSKQFQNVQLKGFYWFYEEVPTHDETLLPSLSQYISSLSPSLMLIWIPYYRPGDPHTGRWKELGFDFATLQPNYAFNNVSADKRFSAIKDLTKNFSLGIEMELPNSIRNPQAGGWENSFWTYLERVRDWERESGTHIMKTYYYGNVFVNYYAQNTSYFAFYTKLFNYIKGIA